MADKTPSRGVVDSIAALRLRRYFERGAGAAPKRAPKAPTVQQLRVEVAKIAVKRTKKKSKKGKVKRHA